MFSFYFRKRHVVVTLTMQNVASKYSQRLQRYIGVKTLWQTKRVHNSIFSFRSGAGLSKSRLCMAAFINAIMRSGKAAFRRAL